MPAETRSTSSSSGWKSAGARSPRHRADYHSAMQSSLHGMIDKAHRYAEEPGRVRLERLEAFIRGDNNSEHAVKLSDGRLSCDCDHYLHERLCAHVLDLRRDVHPDSQRPARP